tara:strand:+ start:564 stop:1625 length:1062 start_codon:yes stop_codon:yes gene_type:complete
MRTTTLKPAEIAIRPEYIIPTMEYVADIPWNGYKVISTFSGAGGSCLGFEMAGYRVIWANEFVAAARDVYRLNHPGVILSADDIRTLTPEAILENAGVMAGEIDVMEGSPPCASFSSAGRRENNWGIVKNYSDTTQRTDDLFFDYARCLKGIQPKVFVAENVAGLVRGVSKGYFKTILEELKGCGYNVECRMLDAKFLGVPQSRKRVIFMGVRRDLGIAPSFPKPYQYFYSIADVLPHVRRYMGGGSLDRWISAKNPMATVMASAGTLSPTAYFSANGYMECKDENGVLETRKFNISELKKLCSFPEDFALTGTFEQQWERLGRSVPPLMMRAIANHIAWEILQKIGGNNGGE